VAHIEAPHSLTPSPLRGEGKTQIRMICEIGRNQVKRNRLIFILLISAEKSSPYRGQYNKDIVPRIFLRTCSVGSDSED
jgi:hypothetical protein